MATAKEVYMNQLETAYEANDVNFIMLAVRQAPKAQVVYSQEIASWAEAAERTESAAGNSQMSLAELLDAINIAGEARLPETPELQAVKGKAQRIALQEIAEATVNGSSIQELDP